MAQGDAVTRVQSIAAGSSLSYQPAAGEHVLFTEFGSANWAGGAAPDGYPNLRVALGGGSIIPNLSTILQWAQTLRVFVNNSAILYVTNQHTASAEIAISGVQIK